MSASQRARLSVYLATITVQEQTSEAVWQAHISFEYKKIKIRGHRVFRFFIKMPLSRFIYQQGW